ncbi:Atc1p KNAG_0A04720 [Huiozyma naganishii CBS 8797]|uniref:Protein ATC1/LIC4 n=1 Tax=Huiozyma naganishii (strain ATCC MYA-139 / BCRC 22969 / CBS 8797 / KCTC 17520 / NBRC 10181 / NCYC 3082 / Yp74L-3) TaxID=1071383 RepID=J7RF07_HUIN7|nr:hypothetical protein KNAG_0A04720 [Kazachstania naganishii CBS 8797]CCK68143.1 hypothetical protein KNAG_0A04720 [Kazachstania naganishii CBS 8797]
MSSSNEIEHKDNDPAPENIEKTLHQLLDAASHALDTYSDNHREVFSEEQMLLEAMKPDQFQGLPDFEKAFEKIMGNIDAHGLMDSTEGEESGSISPKLSCNADQINSPHTFFQLDEMDFPAEEDDSGADGVNNSAKRKLADTEDHDSSINKKKMKALSSTNEKQPITGKVFAEPFLSPASLSPMSSLSSEGTDSRDLKLDRRGDNVVKGTTRPAISQTIHIKGKVEDSETNLPEKLTNEYTMKQVSEMKKRIINTHKLILNFNFLKDGYARTCIELKKSLQSLKESEVHRAHLLLENEQLRERLARQEQYIPVGKNDDAVTDT